MSKKFQEYTAPEIVSNSNRQGRVFTPNTIEFRNFNTRTNTLFLKVGKYIVQIALPDLKIFSKDQGTPEAKIELAVTGDVKVYCQCADYQYRFAYVDTQLGIGIYKETRPAKITNPNGNGTVCKHGVAALTNLSTFVPDMAKVMGSKTTEELITQIMDGQSANQLLENVLYDNPYGSAYLEYIRDIGKFGKVTAAKLIDPLHLTILLREVDDLKGLENFVKHYNKSKLNLNYIKMEIRERGTQFLEMTLVFLSPVSLDI